VVLCPLARFDPRLDALTRSAANEQQNHCMLDALSIRLISLSTRKPLARDLQTPAAPSSRREPSAARRRAPRAASGEVCIQGRSPVSRRPSNRRQVTRICVILAAGCDMIHLRAERADDAGTKHPFTCFVRRNLDRRAGVENHFAVGRPLADKRVADSEYEGVHHDRYRCADR
jgi:hypothetical protein